MILGLGTDIVEVSRIKRVFDRFGNQFLNRILLPSEVAYCLAHKNPAPYLAARFAAKEAVAKAFGTGVGAELGWRDIEIAKKPNGEPYVILHSAAATLLAKRGGNTIFISLSHTEHFATATALLAD
jgi:holo-[acyl-carrier protein] synthase